MRALGRELGLPEKFVGRHPFPGPGLAIRCPGDITREKLDILRRADAVYIEEIRRAGLYDAIWQAFAPPRLGFPPVRGSPAAPVVLQRAPRRARPLPCAPPPRCPVRPPVADRARAGSCRRPPRPRRVAF